MSEAVTELEAATMVASPEAIPGAAPETVPPTLLLTVIEPTHGWGLSSLGELWRYRELLVFLAWRDVKIRYKQTVLGIGWAVAQPIGMMLLFTLLLGRISGVAAGIEHYPLFAFTGMVAWTFFYTTVTTAGNSVVANEHLITKVYFPRLIVPLATVGVSVFDLAIGSVLLAGMMLLFGVAPGWSLLLMPVIVLALGVAAVGFGVLFAALIVAQRDFKYVLALSAQFWLFATPCIYVSDLALGESARTWLPLNPAYGLVLAFRQAALGSPIDWYSFGLSASVGVLVFLVGVIYFRRVERSFADRI